jgi:ribosomal protein S21|tara:strand:- start:389 stop:580 length:192 start_codon:yes stop_codon:yes gene_type:complete
VPRRNEPIDRAIKRFIKKCKKMKIIEKYRERTDYYEKPSVARRKKAIRRQRAIQKANKANANR